MKNDTSKKILSNNVVVVSTHPDDETLGCGGTILKHKLRGGGVDNVFCIFVTNILESQGFSKDKIAEREMEIEYVSKMFNFDKIFKLDYPTTTLTPNTLPNLISDISKIFNEIKPNIVYLPNYSDIHSDHRITFDASIACTKSFRYPFIEKILMFETISETEFAYNNHFIPNYYIDISEYLENKLEIMKIYKSELQEPPMPRSLENIKALATFRGSSCNKKYAEAFKIIKIIEN